VANTIGEKELRRSYPVVSGIEASQKHEGRKSSLVPEKESLILDMHRRTR